MQVPVKRSPRASPALVGTRSPASRSSAVHARRYWDKQTQIDLVSLRDDAWTDLGECKWGPVRSAGALLDALDAKVARYPNPRGASIGRRIFTRHAQRERGPKRSPRNWHSLDEFYR